MKKVLLRVWRIWPSNYCIFLDHHLVLSSNPRMLARQIHMYIYTCHLELGHYGNSWTMDINIIVVLSFSWIGCDAVFVKTFDNVLWSYSFQIEAIVQDISSQGRITNIEALNIRLDNQVRVCSLSTLWMFSAEESINASWHKCSPCSSQSFSNLDVYQEIFVFYL